MRKWKRDYLSVMNRTVWKSEEGMTLIELMASLAILSIVILLVGSVHIFGQRQFINQTESASQANDLSYSLSVMSRDLRKQDATSISVNESNNQILINKVPIYTLEGTSLKKGPEVLSSRVDNVIFKMNIVDDVNESITITLSSTDNQQNLSNQYQTTIYFRR